MRACLATRSSCDPNNPSLPTSTRSPLNNSHIPRTFSLVSTLVLAATDVQLPTTEACGM